MEFTPDNSWFQKFFLTILEIESVERLHNFRLIVGIEADNAVCNCLNLTNFIYLVSAFTVKSQILV